MLVNSLADRIVAFIHKHDPNASSPAVLRYGLVQLINQLIVMGIVLVTAAITGHFWIALLCSLAFPFLRQFSGGLHLASMHVCNTVTATFVLVAVYTPIVHWYTGFVVNLIAIAILAIYAPSNTRQSKLSRFTRKFLSVGIAAINLLLQWPELSVLFIIQACTTTPPLQAIAHKVNQLIKG